MPVTDPIADMLTRIRNANMAYQEKVDIPASKLKQEMARILKEEGFIKNYKYIEDRKQGIIRVYLKYSPKRERIIRGLKRVSKSSLRTYVSQEKIPRVSGGLGIAIISTSKGIMTGKQCRRARIGGEVLCHIW